MTRLTRRDLLALIGGTTAAWPILVAAEPSKIHRVGFLSSTAPITEKSPLGAGIIRNLTGHDHLRGESLEFESRGAEAHLDRLPRLVRELEASKVDVIVA